jgi:hypothetical protein
LIIRRLKKEIDDGKWLRDVRKIAVITPLRRGRLRVRLTRLNPPMTPRSQRGCATHDEGVRYIRRCLKFDGFE